MTIQGIDQTKCKNEISATSANSESVTGRVSGVSSLMRGALNVAQGSLDGLSFSHAYPISPLAGCVAESIRFRKDLLIAKADLLRTPSGERAHRLRRVLKKIKLGDDLVYDILPKQAAWKNQTQESSRLKRQKRLRRLTVSQTHKEPMNGRAQPDVRGSTSVCSINTCETQRISNTRDSSRDRKNRLIDERNALLGGEQDTIPKTIHVRAKPKSASANPVSQTVAHDIESQTQEQGGSRRFAAGWAATELSRRSKALTVATMSRVIPLFSRFYSGVLGVRRYLFGQVESLGAQQRVHHHDLHASNRKEEVPSWENVFGNLKNPVGEGGGYATLDNQKIE